MVRTQTIFTITANCQDCYRCVRECPVKAIRVTGGQAMVQDDLCIKCGTCVRECPQHAKTVRSDLEAVKALIAEGRVVAASVAPSFAAQFKDSFLLRLPSALRQLGFKYVSETAEGAKYTTEKSFESGHSGSICSACPTVVNYIEKYKPEYLDSLIPVVSPMIAHGRMLKAKYPDCAVVFIGPCAAKKQEILRPENLGAVDEVLTFIELDEWLEQEGIRLENCTESSFDRISEIGDARLFPILGGMLKTGGVSSDGTQANVIHVSGAHEVLSLFSGEPDLEGKLIEPLFCKGGCIGGPCFTDTQGEDPHGNPFERRNCIIRYAETMKKLEKEPKESIEVPYRAEYVPEKEEFEEVPMSEIQKIFENTGKSDPKNQLNCGACGYKSCVDNAIAVVRGLAEPEMCIPYMKRLAQQRTDKIIETTPNGIVILDSELCIIKMNPAFQRMFMCNNGILGRRISYLLNAEGFERLQSGELEQFDSIQVKYGIKYHEILYALRSEGQYVGIYSDISKLTFDSGHLETIKAQTLHHAKEFLEHQVRFAQEMAHYLGKSAAESEKIAKRLINLYEKEGGETKE
jgi:iron only hydrogenase large subunit-like protein/uncharacterized Fe-S cluster-containing protein